MIVKLIIAGGRDLNVTVDELDMLLDKYFGKKICTKDEFISKFINDSKFLELYSSWQDNYFQRKFAPSIDRINNDLDYTLDNIEFISQSSNSKKDWSNKVYVIEGGIKKIFESQLALANYLNTHTSIISIKINTNKKYKGLEIGKL